MSPAQTISLGDLFDEIHVDIEGDKFKLREATRSVEEKYRRKLRELEAKEAEEPDTTDEDGEDKPDAGALEAKFTEESLEIYGDLLDIWLEPLGESRTHAKTLVKKAYKADKIGLSHLGELVRQIGQAGQKRPT